MSFEKKLEPPSRGGIGDGKLATESPEIASGCRKWLTSAGDVMLGSRLRTKLSPEMCAA